MFNLKKFLVKKSFCSEIIFCQKKKFCPENNFWSEKIFGPKNFWSGFRLKKFYGPK